MEIGKEKKTIVIEPIESPIPNRELAPTREPAPIPEPTKEPVKV